MKGEEKYECYRGFRDPDLAGWYAYAYPVDPKNKNDLTCISKWEHYLILLS
jgi:hypothetical protein